MEASARTNLGACYVLASWCFTAHLLARLKAAGVKLAMLIVLVGEIIDRDPDDVGTNFGHLCQQPAKVAELRKRLSRRGSVGRRGTRKRRHPGNVCMEVGGEPTEASTVADGKRRRTTAEVLSVTGPETMSAEDVDDSLSLQQDRSS